MPARSRPAHTPWWGIGVLSALVAASSFAVPAVLPGQDEPTPATRPTAVVTSATEPSPTSTSITTTEASPTPEPTTPSPGPTFEPLTINPWAKKWESAGIAVIDCPTCASGKRVQYLGQGHYVIVRLRHVPVAGRRTMTVIYTCACDEEPRDLDVMVNSGPVQTFPLKGAKSWETPARFTMKIRLEKGSNVIRFSNQDDPAPDLDQILIR